MMQRHSVSFSVDPDVPVPEKYRPRSRIVSRLPAYPAFCPDLSHEVIAENIDRRTVHGKILAENERAFRKRDLAKTGEYMKAKHSQRHFLDTMHPLQLNPCKSRLPPKSKNITTAADLAPLQDFAVPADILRPRTTGYSPGHVRSMLQYDTFGPLDSEIKSTLRETGSIPQSPNIDHYRPQSPNKPHSRASPPAFSSRPGDGQTTANLIGNGLSESVSSLEKGKATALRLTSASFSPSQTNAEVLKISYDDKAKIDPFSKSRSYFKSYQLSVEEKKARLRAREEVFQKMTKTEILAMKERNSIQEFENGLRLKTQHV